MSAAIRALHPSKCPLCRGPIVKGDTIALHEDRYAHDACIPSPEPWDETGPDISTRKLVRLMHVRPTLLRAVYDAGLDAEDLPKEISDALFRAMAYESTLVSLVEDVASRVEETV